jgi:predicted dehydrogenase
MGKQYGIGIIGYGGFGRYLHNAWKDLDNVRIVAVSDKNPDNNPMSEISFYDQWQDLLGDERIEIVSIAVPPVLHKEIACAAFEAGRHVLIEKPLATTPSDALEIIKSRDESGCIAAVNYMMRFNPLIVRIREMTQSGIFGKLRRADVENYAQDECLPASHWFWNKTSSGGILVEHAVHFIDLIDSLTDETPVKIHGMRFNRDEIREDRVMANILYNGGLMATHYHAFSRPGFFEINNIRLCYDLADIELEGWIPLKGRIRVLTNEKNREQILNLQGFIIREETGIDDVADESRPVGWGETSGETERKKIVSGGVSYDVDQMISGTFGLSESKGDVYIQCLRSMLEDVIRAAENPEHRVASTLENGLKSLDMAYTASSY